MRSEAMTKKHDRHNYAGWLIEFNRLIEASTFMTPTAKLSVLRSSLSITLQETFDSCKRLVEGKGANDLFADTTQLLLCKVLRCFKKQELLDKTTAKFTQGCDYDIHVRAFKRNINNCVLLYDNLTASNIATRFIKTLPSKWIHVHDFPTNGLKTLDTAIECSS
jgi:hypothetical protein